MRQNVELARLKLALLIHVIAGQFHRKVKKATAEKMDDDPIRVLELECGHKFWEKGDVNLIRIEKLCEACLRIWCFREGNKIDRVRCGVVGAGADDDEGEMLIGGAIQRSGEIGFYYGEEDIGDKLFRWWERWRKKHTFFRVWVTRGKMRPREERLTE